MSISPLPLPQEEDGDSFFSVKVKWIFSRGGGFGGQETGWQRFPPSLPSVFLGGKVSLSNDPSSLGSLSPSSFLPTAMAPFCVHVCVAGRGRITDTKLCDMSTQHTRAWVAGPLVRRYSVHGGVDFKRTSLLLQQIMAADEKGGWDEDYPPPTLADPSSLLHNRRRR